jgi:L-alanine-DL-glutamate epimerase-like enolase superfamily enzyme
LDYYPWQADIFSPNFEIVKGQLTMNHHPGWGIELNPEWLSHAQYQVSYTGSRF